MYNKSIKITYIVIGIYMFLYLALSIRRTIYLWQEQIPELGDFLFNKGEFILLALIVTIAIIIGLSPRSQLAVMVNKLTQVKPLIIACITILMVCFILTLLRIPGLWWTWHSVGMYAGIIFLMALLLRNRMPTGEAFMFGCGCALITMGIWEIIYQYGFWYFYTAPLGAPFSLFLGVVKFMSPFVFAGLVILLDYGYRHHMLQLNISALICFVVTIGCLTYWFVSGLWCDAVCAWPSNYWYSNPESNNAALTVYRSSKVCFNLVFVSLIWRDSWPLWLSKRISK